VTSVVDGMCGVKRRLEDDSGFEFAGGIVVAFFFVPKRVLTTQTERRGPRGRLKLSGTLPLGTTGEPEHQPVIGIVLFREVGGEKECWEKKF
jgi:hypothetical protein